MTTEAEVRYQDGTGDVLRVVQVGNKVVFGIITDDTTVDAPAASVVLEPEQWEDLKVFLNRA
jgi:copper homeostasis protein CutC